jgi:hypothetical protein
MNEEEVEAQLEELVRENERLKKENDLMESYLRRNSQSATGAEEEEQKGKKNARQRKQRQMQTLTMDQKNDIASAELEEVQKEVEETKRSSERLIDTLRAVLEETDIRIAELKKDAYEFKRDIVVGAENFRTGKTMAEKVIRYMEDKLRQKDSIIEKLRLKNATLKSQAQKVDAQLRQKEEMGDVLHYIDFHQLQIENKQYVAKIEERNDELLKLKMTTGNTVQVLNNLKRKLNNLISESEWLKNEIKTRTELCAKIKEDNKRVQVEIGKASRTNKQLQTQLEAATDMPEVLDYVKQKAEVYELQQAVRNWERKVEIAELALKRMKSEQNRAAAAQGMLM